MMIMLKRRMIAKKKQSVSFVESFAMLEEMEKCFFLDDESQMMLSTLTKNFEDLQIKNKKQEWIKAYFSWLYMLATLFVCFLKWKKYILYVMRLFFNPWKAYTNWTPTFLWISAKYSFSGGISLKQKSP